ncbi:MAG: nucleotidyltransferase domain-containing protein [Candidatus Muirbacterium halophilum]|nr:nucleotidyltransferase domain-containing protein [Candidatus Muirbacterium halophilum]MCK9475879.1 nucleotidyltransferase domain-containing protein [Candidatus Muirbacterium halophilum]
MYTRETIIEKVNILKKRLIEAGFEITDIYLFGSYYNNSNNEYSDIDIAIIAENFTGIRFYDIEKIAEYKLDLVDFEIHPFKKSDFEEGNPFIQHIKENSKKIA